MGATDRSAAIVTGGRRGIGRAIAHALAEAGFDMTVVDIESGAAARETENGLRERGARSIFVEADIADLASHAKIIERSYAAFGRLDCLVNCAGLTDRGSILSTTPEVYDRLFDVNARAPFFLIQEAAKLMRRDATAGTVVNVISMSAHGGQPFLAAYSASKAALAALTRNAAYALMPDRIRVNGLNLGWADTPGEDSIQRREHGARDGWLAAAEAAQPFGRLIKPAEAARAIAFLASDESGLMTGSIVDFDQSVLGAYDAAPQPARRLD